MDKGDGCPGPIQRQSDKTKWWKNIYQMYRYRINMCDMQGQYQITQGQGRTISRLWICWQKFDVTSDSSTAKRYAQLVQRITVNVLWLASITKPRCFTVCRCGKGWPQTATVWLRGNLRLFKDFQLPLLGLYQWWCTTLYSVYLIIWKH